MTRGVMSVEVMSNVVEDSISSMEVQEEEELETPQYIHDLFTDDTDKLLHAVTTLKNMVIGSNRQKTIAIKHGILSRVLTLLGDVQLSEEIRRESCIVLGSLVKGTEDNVSAVVDACSVPVLIRVLSSEDPRLVEYALTCLKTIFSHRTAPKDVLYEDPGLIRHLLTLMNESVANKISVSSILSDACSNADHQITLANHGVVTHLAALLVLPSIKVQMPAVKCLTEMSYKNEQVSSVIAEATYNGKKLPDLLVSLLSRDKPAKMQLQVATCFTYLHRANALTSTDDKVCMKTLPCLVRMCSKDHDTETRVAAAETLSYLIEVDKELQAIAAISNRLIPTLADYIKPVALLKPISGSQADMYKAAFKAFASLGANDEQIRKRIIETEPLMERVVECLDEPNPDIALAAVRCLHSLSRSVQQLRTTFKDHSVWKPLLKLLQNSRQDILAVASSTLCNLLLEFSPSKEPILESGAVDVLCNLTRNEDVVLRLNGIWALMNVAFQADQRLKSQILVALGMDQIFRLLSDDEANIVMKTLGLLRNLLTSAAHIDHIMGMYGKQIMQASILILEGDHGPDTKEQALCMLSNIADGFSAKEFIMTNDDVLKKITSYLSHSSPKLQTAAVMCVSNLAWKEEEGSLERQAKLKELGVQKLLHSLITTSDQNLFDRVKTALNQFSPN